MDTEEKVLQQRKINFATKGKNCDMGSIRETFIEIKTAALPGSHVYCCERCTKVIFV